MACTSPHRPCRRTCPSRSAAVSRCRPHAIRACWAWRTVGSCRVARGAREPAGLAQRRRHRPPGRSLRPSRFRTPSGPCRLGSSLHQPRRRSIPPCLRLEPRCLRRSAERARAASSAALAPVLRGQARHVAKAACGAWLRHSRACLAVAALRAHGTPVHGEMLWHVVRVSRLEAYLRSLPCG